MPHQKELFEVWEIKVQPENGNMIKALAIKDVIAHGLSCAAKNSIAMDLPAYLPGEKYTKSRH